MTHATPPGAGPGRAVEEVPLPGLPAVVHREWSEAFPWLVQGTTRATGGDGGSFDLGLFGDASAPREVLARWHRLRSTAGMLRVVHAHQVHGGAVRWHGAGPPGLHLADPCDGHATADDGLLLAVTVADCVPVSLVDPGRRTVALVHAGWRGTAAGILECGLAVLSERAATPAADVHVHLGPAICRNCYEVGPEVFAALDRPTPDGPAPLDLRRVLAERAVAAGVPERQVTVSTHCTCCGSGFFSHRGGDRGRQVGFLGMRGP